MTQQKKDILADMLADFFFTFQMETGLILAFKKLGFRNQSFEEAYDGFELEIQTDTGKILATYEFSAKNKESVLRDNYFLSKEQETLINKTFQSFFRTFKLKTLFLS